MKTVGVLLAGGQSQRYGSPKAFALHEGHSFYHYSLEALRPICEEIVVVARPEYREQFPDCVHVTTDLEAVSGMGPLAGILSAMELVQADRYVVLPCDMPFMEAGIMKRLLALHHGDISSVTVEGKRHPLVSVWSANVKPTIKQALRDGNRRVMHVQAQHEGRWIEGDLLTDTPEISFKNVNKPCELGRG
ncbi:molybdenum cofactor guanylyltransferase [Sporosarcina sp. P16b]|uniref:molybdenum cofactor guanylyltransferase n=1 Tax=Sporosarcina sp. P16b TaxID=2048261 RepID=UPI000C172417|nr:molybdenum cofactor guanylyltransferase [Sporosarcina sp. P16b]PIC71171.1 molybdenum cofactor guanylyltransferase [Sporosarcina sp. P16b]